MNCPRCGKENEDGARFCSLCGTDLVEYIKESQREQEADEIEYCFRHPKVETRLKCGRCEKPICDKCVVIGPAGPRCPECAKSNVAFRPAAVTLGAKRSVRSLFKTPWMIYILVIGGIFLFNLFRGCNFFFGPKDEVIISGDEMPVEDDF